MSSQQSPEVASRLNELNQLNAIVSSRSAAIRQTLQSEANAEKKSDGNLYVGDNVLMTKEEAKTTKALLEGITLEDMLRQMHIAAGLSFPEPGAIQANHPELQQTAGSIISQIAGGVHVTVSPAEPLPQSSESSP